MFLGRETLIHGLTIYMENMAYGSAVEEDLFRDLEAAAILDGVWPQEGVDDFEKTMKTWTNQAGLPLVTVTRDGKELHLEQSWYTEGEGGERLWDIPLTEGFGENFDPRKIFWFTEKQVTIPTNVPDFFLLNRQGMGYYRHVLQFWNTLTLH